MNKQENGRETGIPKEAKFEPVRLEKLAHLITGQSSLNITEGDKGFIIFNPGGSQLAEIVKRIAKEKGAEVRELVSDKKQLAERLKNIDLTSPDAECQEIAEPEIAN